MSPLLWPIMTTLADKVRMAVSFYACAEYLPMTGEETCGQEQRDRSKAKAATGKQFSGMHFDMDAEGHWDFKNNINLVKYLESPDIINSPNEGVVPAPSAASTSGPYTSALYPQPASSPASAAGPVVTPISTTGLAGGERDSSGAVSVVTIVLSIFLSFVPGWNPAGKSTTPVKRKPGFISC